MALRSIAARAPSIGTVVPCPAGNRLNPILPLPMACEPIEIAGFNRMWRQLLIDGIKADPAWVGGEYTAQPAQGLRTAASLLFVAVSAPVQLQKDFPDGNQAIAYARDKLAALTAVLDANDLIYQVDASRNYNPRPRNFPVIHASVKKNFTNL